MNIKPVSDLYLITYEDGTPYKSTRDAKEAVDAIGAGFKVEEFVSLENHRAAMLQAEPVTTANKSGNSPAQGPIDHGYRKGCECSGCKTTVRICAELATNSPVIPDGYVMVPKEPTEEMNKAGWAAMNEHDAINPTYRAMLAAAPQDTPALNSVQSVVTVSDTWIPVSERMPENKPGSYEYLVFETLNNRVNHDYWNVPDAGDEAFTPFWNHYGEYVTHWMPLPAAPQEVK